MEFIELAELCDKGSSNLAQKDLVFDSGIYPVYGAPGEITKVDFFHQSKPYLGLIKDGAGVGRVMKLPADSSVIGTIQYIFPKENVDLKYLYYLIKYLDLGKSNTGATIPHIYFKDYKKRKVKVREYGEQKHIGQILELIDSHLSAYKTVLEQYDLLIKSRFVELFGDVVLNTLNWPLVKLSAIAEYRIGLTYKPEAVSSSGIAVLRSGNIQNSQLCYEDTIYVNSKVEPKLLLKKNDILMCARNGSQSLVGKVALIENDISNTTYGAFMMAISSKYYVYLFEYFRSQAFRRLISVGSTTTINQVTTRMLNSIVIPLPDLDTINRFALYHSQINKLKFA
ncbi:MAG: restriction endonuclease subunit S [Veillonella sp.]|uniref:restriction endonuclease subunit S n=1 Tax=Veillonella sp. TaxID=1926307 RepID=UPI00257DE47F|nr:restriction endonuclease subunit S [Veillonella sp.]MBS6893156.1 restriction endonuclease subunit S [Veillonella sp.]